MIRSFSSRLIHRQFRHSLTAVAIFMSASTGGYAQVLSEGPHSPGTVANDSVSGTSVWITPQNAGASDNAVATTGPGGIPSQFLKATGFGFSIPSVAQVNGIEASVERRSLGGTIVDAAVRIVKGGVVGATDRSAVGFWPMADAIATYGDDSDLWGETWTPTDVNSPGFGVAISVTDTFDTAGVDHITLTVYYTLCGDAPAAGCRTAGKSTLSVSDKTPDSKDKLSWKWTRGESTATGEFANPVSTAVYSLCIYAGATSALIADALVPPHATKWEPISTKGFRYKDKIPTEDGIQRITLKASIDNKSKATVKGKGTGLPDITPPLSLPVTVQLVNSDSGICWESSYTTLHIKKNETGKFKAKFAP